MTDERFGEAALAFDAAYRLDPHPTLLYNAALAYERAGDSKAAVERYQSFLIEKDAPEELRRKALEKVVVLELAMREAAAPPIPKDAPVETPPPVVAPAPEPDKPSPDRPVRLAPLRVTTTVDGDHSATAYDATGDVYPCSAALSERSPCDLQVPLGSTRLQIEGELDLDARLEISSRGARVHLPGDNLAAFGAMWAGWGATAAGVAMMGAAIGVAGADPGTATDLGYAGQAVFWGGLLTGGISMIVWLAHDELEVSPHPTP